MHPFKLKATYTASLGEIDLGRTDGEERVVRAMDLLLMLIVTGKTDRKDMPRRDVPAALPWVFEQLPRTVVTFEPRDNASWYEIVATFANETDAVAFKTRWC